MQFNCDDCGRQIIAEDSSVGKKGKCPGCGTIIRIPAYDPDIKIELQSEPNDPFPDLELKPETDDQDSGVFDFIAQDAADRSNTAHIEDSEQIGHTGHSAFVEILTYPAVSAGWIILSIFVGVPAVADFIRFLMKRTPGLLMLIFIPILLIALMVCFTVSVYMFWYFTLCIQQSALGSARMPDSLIEDNGFWDMFTTTLRVFACVIIFLGPAAVCYHHYGKFTIHFWAILAAGVFFLPMAFMTTTFFDSISGLNPYHIIRGVILTFKSYIFVALGYFLFVALIVVPMLYIQVLAPAPFGLVARGIYVYCLFIMGQLAGRLYFKYSEKLNWEI